MEREIAGNKARERKTRERERVEQFSMLVSNGNV